MAVVFAWKDAKYMQFQKKMEFLLSIESNALAVGCVLLAAQAMCQSFIVNQN